ncbi:MAG: hypothetical protein EAX86_12255 [Candidatus Heimdallarchaeota archaeon]|nr:hypothetical protein [Candidatus Heimdallarchaeota archaeon]
MSKDAQNIKISSSAWELLRWAKYELEVRSYSDVIIALYQKIELKHLSKTLRQSLKDFDETRHRIKIKTPEDKTEAPYLPKPKTILLRPDAHRILNLLKIESNEPAYTFSDAIEFLAKNNSNLWNKIPNRLK